MPRYNYKCSECNEEIELVHSMSEVATDCPLCKAEASLKKQLSVPRIQTKTVPGKTGAVVKRAIKQYKERIANEQGVWEDFEIEEMLEGKK